MTARGDLVQTVLSCLDDALAGRPNPPGEVCVRVGEVPFSLGLAEDLCCTGLAWVRVLAEQPTVAFPAELDTATPCGAHSRSVTLELGVIRCLPDHGAESGATCEEWTAAFLQNEEDAAAMSEALCCALDALKADPTSRYTDLMVPGAWGPVDGQGGCIGGTRQATFGIDCTEC